MMVRAKLHVCFGEGNRAAERTMTHPDDGQLRIRGEDLLEKED